MTARLPLVGGDDGVWGTILNEFLTVEHNADGTQKALMNPTLTGIVDASAATVKVKSFVPLLPTPVSAAGGVALFDLTMNNQFMISLTGNTTFAIVGANAGEAIKIRITSNGFGVTWWPGITWAGGVTPVLTAGGKADWVILLRTGTNTYDGSLAFGNL